LRLFYWHFLAAMDRLDEAGNVIERGLELDPLNAFAHGSHGLYLLTAKRFPEAIKNFQEILDNKMDYGIAHLGMWTAYHHMGMTARAMEEAKVAFAEDEELLEEMNTGFREAGYKGAMKRAGDLRASRSRLIYELPTNIAKFYAYAGENEKALDQLEAAHKERDSGLVLMQVDPDWNPLRQEPRFKQLVAKMGFPK
jgi:adenylate cyclase